MAALNFGFNNYNSQFDGNFVLDDSFHLPPVSYNKVMKSEAVKQLSLPKINRNVSLKGKNVSKSCKRKELDFNEQPVSPREQGSAKKARQLTALLNENTPPTTPVKVPAIKVAAKAVNILQSPETPTRAPFAQLSNQDNKGCNSPRQRLNFGSTESESKEEASVEGHSLASRIEKGRPKVRSSGIKDNRIAINRHIYELQYLNSGDYHCVYGFKPNQPPIEVGNQFINPENVVLRHASEDANRRKGSNYKHHAADLKVYKQDLEGFLYLRDSQTIKIPKVYNWPSCPEKLDDVYDLKDGNFWLVQRIENRVSTEAWSDGKMLNPSDKGSLALLDYVKGVLTRQATTKRDVANDFYPKNVMCDSKGNFYVVDFSIPHHDDWDCNLRMELREWSANNPKVWEYLISDFPEDVKAEFAVFEAPKSAKKQDVEILPKIPGLSDYS